MINLKSENLKAEWIDINPKLAMLYLETNKQNRNISESTLNKLVKKMKDGKFKVTGQTISFNQDGILQDGQHRLKAILESNTTQKICVCLGIPNDSWNDYDIGKKRTGGDNLAALNVKYSNELSGAIRVWYALKNEMFSAKGLELNNKEIVDIYKQQSDILDEITLTCMKYFIVSGKLLDKTKLIGFAIYLLLEKSYSLDTIKAFYDVLYSLNDVNIKELNGIKDDLKTRKASKTNKMSDYEIYFHLFQSFNFFIGDTKKIITKIKDDTKIKEIKNNF